MAPPRRPGSRVPSLPPLEQAADPSIHRRSPRKHGSSVTGDPLANEETNPADQETPLPVRRSPSKADQGPNNAAQLSVRDSIRQTTVPMSRAPILPLAQPARVPSLPELVRGRQTSVELRHSLQPSGSDMSRAPSPASSHRSAVSARSKTGRRSSRGRRYRDYVILAIGALVVATLAQIIVGLALPSLRPNYLKAFVRDLGDVSGVAENGTVTVPRIADAIYEKVTEDNRNVLFVLHEVVVDSFKRFAVIKSRQDEQTDITTSLQEDVATAKRALGEKADVSEIRRLERVLADKQMSVHARMDRFESALDKATDMSFPPRVPGVVNFLGIGMGAGVFPPLTSTSTAMPSRSRIQEFFSRSMDQSHIDEASKAMNKWSEQGECWCTPVVNGSQWAIYSVADPHVTKVQMEFISSTKAETRHHMRSAPRLFEIWALDPKLRNRPNDMVWQDKSHLTIRSSWKRDYFRDYRKLALFEYKINGPAVQTFDIVDGGRSPIYLIKILNNHGNQEATCVYRIQMLGDSREFQTDQGQ